jgi:zinc/manganese transport system permease protein
LVLSVWFGWWKRRQDGNRAVFYLLFALSVTVSVQLVGIYLVFASLIVPALATRQLPEKTGLGWAYFIGVTGYVTGLTVSALFDLPTGAVIVWSLAAVAVIMSAVRSVYARSHISRSESHP